jgi:cleavage and polyadenylation specificity factor subunit 1
MYAIHSTLLPPSAIHHTLYLPHFTPSTIYPIPRPSSSTSDIKVIGNLIVGGISDLRVFEIREESRPVLPNGPDGVDGDGGAGGEGEEGMIDGEELGDGFLNNGPSHVGSSHAYLALRNR